MNEFYVCKHCSVQAPRAGLNKKGWLVCNPCLRKFQKAYREKHKARLSLMNDEYRIVNKKAINQQRSEYRKANKELIAERNRAARAKNGKKYNAHRYQWKKAKLKSDINFRLQETVRARISMAIKIGAKSGSAVKLLGCSIVDFKQYIENQFLPGMTWDNWSLKGWHLDHIKPIRDYDLSDPVQLAEVCHYTNMRPLWAKDNLARRFEKY